MDCFIIRYGEIALKGKNRPYFEKTLANAVRRSLRHFNVRYSKIKRVRGRILLFSDDKKAIKALKKVFGIVSFSPADSVELSIDNIKEKVLGIIKNKKKSRFKVSTNRLVKEFSKKSQEINEIIGEAILNQFPDFEVSLDNPQLEVGIEISKKEAYIYTEKYDGQGGLPIPTGGKVFVLLSGGIDSPVAAYQIMRRGCNAQLIHFYNELRAQARVPDKIKRIYYRLKEYNPLLKLILVPFSDVEKEIIKKSPSPYRILVLRVLFFRYIEENLSSLPIVTGDNLGQVASQTLDNLKAVSSFSSSLIIRPLISLDKQEVIDLAKQIGTYDISIEPYQDCCNLLLPKHPETHAKADNIKKILDEIEMKQIKPIYLK
jgi:thiamine biosynthesis protein ThiI